MDFVSEQRCVPVSPSERTVGPTGRGQGSKAGPPSPSSGAQLDSGIRAHGQSPTPPGPLRPAVSPAPGRRPKETPPTHPRHPVDKNSRAQALGTVMGATCWPDVPGRDRQECGGPGARGRSRPRHAGPAPARTRQARGALTPQFTFLVFLKVVWEDVGGRGLTSPRSRRSPPPGPTLSASASASARGWSPGSGTPGSPASSAPSRERASGEAGRGGPAPSPLGSAPHPPPATGASPSRSSAPPRCPSASSCGQRPRVRGGLGRLRAPASFPALPLPTYSSCTHIRSSDLFKDSTSSCSLIISPLSLLLSVRFCGTGESRLGVSWGSGVDLIG